MRASVSVRFGAADRMFSSTVRDVEGLVLLGVVAEPSAVAGLDLAGVGLVDAREDAQQRRLARTVEAEDRPP